MAERFLAASLVFDVKDGSERLVLFPPEGGERSVALPISLRSAEYSARGIAVYGLAMRRIDGKFSMEPSGIYRIDLRTLRVSALPGLEHFVFLDRFAVGQDESQIVVGGQRAKGGVTSCGVFELRVADQNIRPVWPDPTCRFAYDMRVLSLSPDGTQALIQTDRSIEVLSLSSGRLTPIESHLLSASFSPDGKWLAVVKLVSSGATKALLLDAKTFSHHRDLGEIGGTLLVWSPDSKFLLHTEYRPACRSNSSLALGTIEIRSGKRVTLSQSVCSTGVGQDVGWVSDQIGANYVQ